MDTRLDGLRTTPAYTVGKCASDRDVRLAMVWANYAPTLGFPALTKVMDELMRGYINVTLTPPFDDGVAAPVC